MEAIIAAAAGIFLFAAIVLICGAGARERDDVRRRVGQMGRQVRHTYSLADEDLSKPLTERLLKPALLSAGRFFARLIPNRRRGRAGDARQKKLLEQAGLSISVDDFLVLQILLMLGLGFALFLLGTILELDLSRRLLLLVFGAFGAYTILRYAVAARGTGRRNAIEQQLPDMLDLLSVSVEAGLGFEQALHHVTENMEGPLIDEVAVTYREMSMGRTRRDALTLLGERCAVPDVQSFASALVQAGQLGIPIKNVLQAQSAAIRRSRRNKVQEKAAKVSTKILIPMLIFIFPVLFIVLLGPSVLTIMSTLK